MTRITDNRRNFSSFMMCMEVALTLVVSTAVIYGVTALNDLPVFSV